MRIPDIVCNKKAIVFEREGIIPVDNHNAALVVDEVILRVPLVVLPAQRISKPLGELRLVIEQLRQQQVEQAPQLPQLILERCS